MDHSRRAGFKPNVGPFTAVLACGLLILSWFFTPIAADHDCAGVDCAVCAAISVHEHLSGAVSPAPISVAHVSGRDISSLPLPPSSDSPCAAVTLVSQKIKLTI